MEKQPFLEELKQDTIYLRYLVNDISPEEGLKRMFYYTELGSHPEQVYLGLSFRKPTTKESFDNMVEKNRLIRLDNKVILPFEKDVWLDPQGDVYLLNGCAPWEDEMKPCN